MHRLNVARFLTSFVLITVVFVIRPSFADTATVNGIRWTYTVSNGEASLGGGSASSTAVSKTMEGVLTVPAKLGGYPVTSIGVSAFNSCRGLMSVTIPDSVASIGNGAFCLCSGLTSVTMDNSVMSIGDDAFYGCSSLTSMTIPNSVTSIGSYAFYGTPFYDNQPDGLVVLGKVAYKMKGQCPASVTIPDGVTNIGASAFSGCSGLTSVTIPDGVTSIEGSAFCECSGLTSVTIPNSVTNIGNFAFYYCSGLTNLTIGTGVTSIGNSAFTNCRRLTSVTIPDSVTSIGDNAFYDCRGLREVSVPQYVLDRQFRNVFSSGYSSITNVSYSSIITNIGNYAFYGCSGLTSVTIPDGVTSIGDWAFYNCRGIARVSIPDGVASIGDHAFYNCIGLTSVTIPDSVMSIKEYAFYGCSGLTSVTIPDGVASIGDYTFHGCSRLTSVMIPDSVASIGQYAFYNCSGLTSVTIPDSVTSIGDYAFYYCRGLTSVAMPDNVASIGQYAFYNCSGLTSVTIPDSVMSIGYRAFYGCSDELFDTMTIVGIKLVDGWVIGYDDSFSGNLDLNGVRGIGAAALNVCSGLTSVTIPDGMSNIGYRAFSGCTNLTSVTIPNGVANITNDIFYHCNMLKNVTIPQSICSSEFSLVFPTTYQSITNVVISDGVSCIGDYVFSGCTGLMSVAIPNSVTNIGAAVFHGCTNLTSVTIPDCVTSIGNYTFYYCSSLTNVTIPNSVTNIGYDAFYNCSELTHVTIPDSVAHIGGRAFYNCSSLTNVTFYGDAPAGISGSSILSYATSVRYRKKYAESYEPSVPASKFGGYVLTAEDIIDLVGCDVSYDDDSPWVDDYDVSHDGEGSMRSGSIENAESTWIETTVNGAGQLSFWWKASSEAYDGDVFDYAYLSVDGVPQGTLSDYRLQGVSIGGKTDWTNVVLEIEGKSPHTIRWTYVKDEIDESDVGGDCVWLDNVTFASKATISFDIGDFAVGNMPEDISAFAGTSVTLPTNSNFAWTDHVFDGWNDGISDYAAGVSYTVPPSNVTLTAKWIAKRFLTFMLGGGDGTIPAIIKGVPNAVVTLPTADGFSKSRYRFFGWSDGTHIYEGGAEYVVTDSDVEFTAVWAANTLAASVITSADVADGGTIEMAYATIEISADSGASIYYTLDGTEPTTNSLPYTAPFVTDGMSVTIRAIAVKDNYFDSPIAEFSFTRKPYSAAECLNVAEEAVATGGENAAWVRVLGETAHDGVAALRSGTIGDGESSSVVMTVEGAGVIGFCWKVSSEISRNRKFDYVSFLIDGKERSWLGGEREWTNEVFAVSGEGTHTLEWVYQKNDNGLTQGEDCAWLDEVTWTPTGGSTDTVVDVGGGKSVTVPGMWLSEHAALVDAAGGDASAALAATAANGRKVWECYALGLDPEDSSATNDFKITSFPLKADGTPDIEHIVFDPPQARWNVPATYRVKGAVRLSDTEWPEVTEGNKANFRFFRVELVLP